MSLLRKGLAAITGTAMTTAAAGVLAFGMASSAQAAELGYGVFVGTWLGNDNEAQDGDPYPWINWTGTSCGASPYGINQLECLIRQAWDGDPNPDQAPFNELGFPVGDPPDQYLNQLNVVGKMNGDGGTDGLLVVDVDPDDPLTGTWTYLQPTDELGRPAPDEIVDIYFLIKGGQYFSIWYYDDVNPNDTGTWSLRDPSLYGATFCDATFVNGMLCIPSEEIKAKGEGTGVFGPVPDDRISHFSAFWPAQLRDTEIPEPATLGLLGLGLLGLGLATRRRQNG